jgi:hypothetical protein
VLPVVALRLGMSVLAFVAIAQAQPEIKIQFELDGKSRSGPSVIEFYQSQRLLSRQRIHRGVFTAPPMGAAQAIDVHVRFGRRVLVFQGVPASKFEGSWKVGIDHPPYDHDNASSVAVATNPKELWFIKFDSSTTDGTRMVVSVPDKVRR